MNTDMDRLVATIAPDPGPGMTPGARDLFQEITVATADEPVAVPVTPFAAVSLRRYLAVAAVAVLTVAVPMVWGGGSAAYAVARNPDGTVTVTIHELQHPEGLQAELIAQGIPADVTYSPPDEQCAPGRFTSVDYAYGSPDPRMTTRRERVEFERPEHWRSRDATQPISMSAFKISPRFIRPGETLVMEFRLGGNGSNFRWSLGSWLATAGSEIAPCTLVKLRSGEKGVR
ncbi:hypothetical protein AB0O34_07285 [Sphaerisporangium sp. NPDC088356]|uniref:hypothetical protein n=1 Tax=Sphaerisporangium sp. NPDC088356 TaxID=3154871 RepID=UPI003429EF8D